MRAITQFPADPSVCRSCPFREVGSGRRALEIVFLAAFVAITAWISTPAAIAQPQEDAMPQTPDTWTDVDRLIAEQRFEAASEKVKALLSQARDADDADSWTRALIRAAQLRLALHGHETAVRFLQDEAWPESPRHHLVLELFKAHALVSYLQAYSWDIEQRERLIEDGSLDLDLQTRDQILGTAHQAYLRVWKARNAWGAESLGDFAEYLQQNDYPARIRGTLRDALTYLWVEQLANSAYWRPEHSSAIYRLDLAAIVAGDSAEAAEAEMAAEMLVDPEVHPVRKIALLLGDLESWHGAKQRPEAAFEARLELLRHLSASFNRQDDRELLLGDLETRLEALGRGFPWWSMGQSLRAELLRQGSTPDALAQAREAAMAGVEAHPDSVGGRRCAFVRAQIEQPSYQLQAMLSDGARKRSILLTHKNVEQLHFRAYWVPLEERLKRQDFEILPGYQDIPRFLQEGEPAKEWSVELPATQDFRDHRTWVIPPLETPGLYTIVASTRSDFSNQRNRLMAVNLVISDLVLLSHRSPDGTEVTARSGSTGEPVKGVELEIHRYVFRQGHALVDTAVTGADGRGVLQFVSGPRSPAIVIGRLGDQLAIDTEPHAAQPRLPEPPEERNAALLYTDRSVYRPLQTIRWKVVAYSGAEAKYAVHPGVTLPIELRDPNGETVATEEIVTNAYGAASGTFEIPPGRLLGGWQVVAGKGSAIGGSASIRVEEYKRPTFEVAFEDPDEAPRLNRPLALRGEARYFFGLPVATGSVEWRVTREPVWPRFGGGRLGGGLGWWPPVVSRPEVVAAGAAEVDADGFFSVAFTPEADERLAEDAGDAGDRLGHGARFRYRVSAEVTDPGGETRETSRVFTVGFVAVEATVEDAAGFLRPGMTAELRLARRDLDGVARGGLASWSLVRLEQPAEVLLPGEIPLEPPPGAAGFLTPGDVQRPRWSPSYDPNDLLARWSAGDEVASGDVEHGEDGIATLALPTLEPGPYRLLYSTNDPFDATFELRHELIVAEDGATRLAIPGALRAERPTVEVGGTARLLIHSGLSDQEMVFELFRGGTRVERRVLESRAEVAANPQARVLEIPIGEEHRGGFGARLTLLRDHQVILLEEKIFVPWDDRELKVELATFRDRLRPGARETWRVTLHGADEERLAAGAAELLAYMYDRSLDLFATHLPPRPAELYPRRTEVPGLRTTIGAGRTAWAQVRGYGTLPRYPHLRPDRLTLLGSHGIGGPGRRGGPGPMMAKTMRSNTGIQAMAMEATEESAEMAMAQDDASLGAAPPSPSPPSPGVSGVGQDEPLRRDFSETAFWEPHLVLDETGGVTFEFTVPDAVTEWSLWVHALTSDLRSGALEHRVRTVKELLVRPQLPRFLREGDRAALEVLVSNAAAQELAGEVRLDIIDPESEASLLADFGLAESDATSTFRVAPDGTAALRFEIEAPRRVGEVAFRVAGHADHGETRLSDGELRPLPLLPGRLHLARSRFAALHGEEKRVLDLAQSGSTADPALDPSAAHEQLVVTLDGQLFYSALGALPYLARYPYQCTEQILNRFLSTGILASLYERYPSVAEMAAKLAGRETRLETWDAVDPNRKIALEETPWLLTARGGEPGDELLNILDPRAADAERSAALAQIIEAQAPQGGFPWWPGGQPSPYMTLYLLQGFSRALEHGVEGIPQDMVVRAWRWIHQHYLGERLEEILKGDGGREEAAFLSYVLSSYPEPSRDESGGWNEDTFVTDTSWTGSVFSGADRRQLLDAAFAGWGELSPRVKGYLALALHRTGRAEDAERVWESVMDSARTSRDLGTYWAPEDRAWLWYNDTIESHALALRVLSELAPEDPRRHGLVQWLFLNKKLNHWTSTRATAEVLYSLVGYLESEESLAAREEVDVRIGHRLEAFAFAPDHYTGEPSRWVLSAAELDSLDTARSGGAGDPAAPQVEVSKKTAGFLFASATWHFATDALPEASSGDLLAVERRYFRRRLQDEEWTLEPIEDDSLLEVGDQVEVQLTLRAAHAAEYVHLRDPRGAGFEPERAASGHGWGLGISWYEEVRDSGTNFFFEHLPAGEFVFKYRVRASHAGRFRVAPAQVQSIYASEFVAYSAGSLLEVENR